MWIDPHWRIHTVDGPQALFFVLVNPREHYEGLPDLPPDRAVELGPLLQPADAWKAASRDFAREMARGGGTAHR
jgi:diadenosine tetraphosphate (Ap4A) HIT family hydrolase